MLTLQQASGQESEPGTKPLLQHGANCGLWTTAWAHMQDTAAKAGSFQKEEKWREISPRQKDMDLTSQQWDERGQKIILYLVTEQSSCLLIKCRRS